MLVSETFKLLNSIQFPATELTVQFSGCNCVYHVLAQLVYHVALDTKAVPMRYTYIMLNRYQSQNRPLIFWGMLHKNYLEKHCRVLFNLLLTQGKLYQHCAEIEEQAINMFDMLVEQMKEAECITEQLKEKNQIAWVCNMQNIESRANELVYKELIYV